LLKDIAVKWLTDDGQDEVTAAYIIHICYSTRLHNPCTIYAVSTVQTVSALQALTNILIQLVRDAVVDLLCSWLVSHSS
jgi:hypothetical protein